MTDDTLTASHIMRMGFSVPPLEPNAGNIIEDRNMVDGPFEDWSRVRSPGRARRRRHKHRQNIRIYYVPAKSLLKLPDGTLVGHPQTVAALYAKIREGIERKVDQTIRDTFAGLGR